MGQKLGFSTFSTLGGTVNQTDETFHYSVGEPIVTSMDSDQLSIRQGALSSEISTATEEAIIQVRFFLDENEDGNKDFDENFLQQGRFTLDGSEAYNIFKQEGISFSAPTGRFDFGYVRSHSRYELTTDELVTVVIDDDTEYVSVLFGVRIDDDCVEPGLKMASEKFKCFNEVNYRVCVMNSGCVPYIDTVYLAIDERIDPESIYFRDVPDVIIDDHKVGWIVEVTPGRIVVLHYQLTAPDVEKPEDVGVIYKSTAWIDLENGSRAEECFSQELKCSYDPNDKLVSPDREDNLALLADELVYTIRFQNTGNDYADDVVVIDTLSDHLDLSTFNLLYTSHPRELEILFPETQENIIQFQFKNIFLPDSTTNEAGSNGQVMFSIRTIEGLPLNTEIQNTGYIYFDRNPAIITNTTRSIMVDEYPIVATEELLESSYDIFAYPNPSNGIVYLSEVVDQVTLYDLSGRPVYQKRNSRKIDASQVTSGTYLLEISKGTYRHTEKLVLFNHQ